MKKNKTNEKPTKESSTSSKEMRRTLYKDVKMNPEVAKLSLIGALVLIVFVGGFLFWGTFFSLESAAVATGKVIVESSRKTIQHLEGGIVKAIYVTEGQKVKEGDLLIELDETQTQANLNLYEGQTNLLLAREAWLIAARDNLNKVEFPERLLKLKDDPKIQKLMNTAQELLDGKNQTIEDGIKILDQKTDQLNSQIQSLQAQVDSNDQQYKFTNEEMKSYEILEKQNYIDKPHILALKRQAAKFLGDRDDGIAKIAEAKQKILENNMQKINLIDSKKNEILRQLEDTEINLVSNLEKETAARDILKRSDIRAPLAGTVMDLKVHTIGGVIGPREPLMEIVPEQDALIVEAHITPNDVEVVHPGLLARVRLVAFKQRTTPTVDGKVITVSADSDHDERTGETFYTARVAVDAEQLAKIPNVSLYPGMPVQVMIIIDKRTPLQYFFQPIKESFNRAFREQ